MINTLYEIYKFVTDIPDLVNILLVAFTVAIPAKAYERVQNASGSKVAGWAVGLVVLALWLAIEYVAYLYVGFPEWLGWIVEKLV
jgi:hypothetical protein